MKISKYKEEEIKTRIMKLLLVEPNLFTSQIAYVITRDEEFILKLLIELRNENKVIENRLNDKNKQYIRRRKWILK